MFIAVTLLLLASVAYAANNETITASTTNTSSMNIVETASMAGDFSTLVTALKTAGLADTLNGSGPFTVFAPTDGAFAQMPKEQLAALLANKTTLKEVLAYHVVPGRIMSSDLNNGMVLKTVEGQDLKISIDDKNVMVDNARVVQPDINASNGVIHAINAVLMPPTSSATMIRENLTTIRGQAEEVAKKAEETVERETPVKEQSETRTPGFEAAFAVAGLLAVIPLALRGRK
ncbi:MAG: fasciclin domain-containing protein [Methanotrichaceae archaeon]|nr:fasciclin domain-containing protein [Methanotrichaceae archaeon]